MADIAFSADPDPQLPLGWRVFFTVSGIVLVLLGIAELALPGPGLLLILIGLALLSLASVTAYNALRWCFRPWPRGWRRVRRWRQKILRKILGEAKPEREASPASAGKMRTSVDDASRTSAGEPPRA